MEINVASIESVLIKDPLLVIFHAISKCVGIVWGKEFIALAWLVAQVHNFIFKGAF